MYVHKAHSASLELKFYRNYTNANRCSEIKPKTPHTHINSIDQFCIIAE